MINVKSNGYLPLGIDLLKCSKSISFYQKDIVEETKRVFLQKDGLSNAKKDKNSLFENRSTEKQSCVTTGDESQHIVLQRCDSKSQAASDNQNSNTG